MKRRDILILVGIVVLIFGLTVAEKYAGRQREARHDEELARELTGSQARLAAAFESRWSQLSGALRSTLDSLAQDVMDSGVSPESLVTILVDTVVVPETTVVVTHRTDTVLVATEANGPPKPAAREAEWRDSLAVAVSREFHRALNALPEDLNAYERRVANDEVASLLRARYNLSTNRFDELLKRGADLQPDTASSG